jgi:hypothetical protein
MTKTFAEMTAEDLRTIVGEAVEEKLVEMLGDPDEGPALREDVRTRLRKQRERLEAGDRGLEFEEVSRRLGLG